MSSFVFFLLFFFFFFDHNIKDENGMKLSKRSLFYLSLLIPIEQRFQGLKGIDWKRGPVVTGDYAGCPQSATRRYSYHAAEDRRGG